MKSTNEIKAEIAKLQARISELKVKLSATKHDYHHIVSLLAIITRHEGSITAMEWVLGKGEFSDEN